MKNSDLRLECPQCGQWYSTLDEAERCEHSNSDVPEGYESKTAYKVHQELMRDREENSHGGKA